MTAGRQQTPIDEVISELYEQVARYSHCLDMIINGLEVAKPEGNCNQPATPKPETFCQAVRIAVDSLNGINNRLEETKKRIQEQVGELKPLP